MPQSPSAQGSCRGSAQPGQLPTSAYFQLLPCPCASSGAQRLAQPRSTRDLMSPNATLHQWETVFLARSGRTRRHINTALQWVPSWIKSPFPTVVSSSLTNPVLVFLSCLSHFLHYLLCASWNHLPNNLLAHNFLSQVLLLVNLTSQLLCQLIESVWKATTRSNS